MFSLTGTVLTGVLSTIAQEADPAWSSCQQSQAIVWFRPGSLSQALDECRRTGRILMIKGVSFGIDEDGLRCPTHGVW